MNQQHNMVPTDAANLVQGIATRLFGDAGAGITVLITLANRVQAATSEQQDDEAQGGALPDVDLKWLAGSIGEVAHRLRTYMPHAAEWADRARDCGVAAKVLGEIQGTGRHPLDMPCPWAAGFRPTTNGGEP